MTDDSLNASLFEQMLEDFFVESQEILDRLGPHLTRLEQSPTPDLVNTIFRELHTLKGTAGFVGLSSIHELAHKMEDVFGEIRASRLVITPELIDAVLVGVQVLAEMRDNIQQGQAEGDPAQAIAQLDTILRSEPAQPVPLPSESVGSILPPFQAEPELQPCLPRTEDLHQVELTLSETSVSKYVSSAETTLGDSHFQSPPTPRTESTLRVETETINTLMMLTGELLTVRNALSARAEVLKDERLEEQVNALSRLTRQFQTVVSSVRLVPVERLFQRFNTVVRNLARGQGCQIQLVFEGEDTLLDRTIIEQMYEPIVHMIRNSVDHGMESVSERFQAGKPEAGTIILSAERRGEHVMLQVRDDGRGIDPAQVRKAAIQRGICTPEEAAMLNDEQAIRLIFAPGFSTASAITELSGRGVGMDVVLQGVRRLRGSIDIESQIGQGTTFILKLPLTLAVLHVLLVRVGPYNYALPLHIVRETLLLSPEMIQTMQHKEVVFLRNKVLPVHFVKEILHNQTETGVAQATPGVVIQLARGDEILVVDELVGKQQIVIKPLGPYLGSLRGIEGSAILPDGSVTLILEVEGLLA